MTGEIVMASESGCPIEHHRIPVDKCDHMYDPECQGAKYMPFLRAAYDRATGQSPNSPREQVNIQYSSNSCNVLQKQMIVQEELQ